MKIKELIARLSEYDPELIVCVEDSVYGYFECTSMDLHVEERGCSSGIRSEQSKNGKVLILWG